MTVPIAHQPSQQRGTWDVTPCRSRGSGPPGLLEWSFRLRHDSFRCRSRPQASRLGIHVASRVILERIGPAMEPGEGQMGNVGLREIVGAQPSSQSESVSKPERLGVSKCSGLSRTEPQSGVPPSATTRRLEHVTGLLPCDTARRSILDGRSRAGVLMIAAQRQYCEFSGR